MNLSEQIDARAKGIEIIDTLLHQSFHLEEEQYTEDMLYEGEDFIEILYLVVEEASIIDKKLLRKRVLAYLNQQEGEASDE